MVTTSLLWYVARASGLVAWGALAGSVIWGLLMTTKAMGRRVRPAWMLDLHRYLGALAVVFTMIHVLGIVFDTYSHVGVVSALVPFADRRTTVPLAFGIVSMYFLGAVEVTSLARKRLSRKLWRALHMLSFPLFMFSTLHAITEGTDSRNILVLITGGLGIVAVLILGVFRLEDVVDTDALTANSQPHPRVP